MSYSDLTCDVKQTTAGSFTNSIVIQHHDLIVTSSDLGLNVQCYYDLTNKTINNMLTFDSEGERYGDVLEDGATIHSTIVAPPNVSIVITNKYGDYVSTAKVGDQLTLKFVITDDHSE